MYKDLLNLRKLPFENVPDPFFFYDSGDFSRILANLTNSLLAGRGLMVVTGAIGSGKTTLSQMVMNRYSGDLKLIWIAEPPESGTDLLIFIARELGLAPSDNRVFLLNDIRSALLDYGNRCLLILDEAHLMSDDVVKTLKALNNLELMSKKFIQIILLGQDELLEIINRPEMLPFKQRIALLETIGRMQRSEVRDYIQFRLKAAGGNSEVFTEDAIEAIAIGSGSVPRVVNSLCDKALYHAVSKNRKIAEVVDVYDAAQGMVDRKEIFQFMLNIKDRPLSEDEKPGLTVPGEVLETGASMQGDVLGHADKLPSPEPLLAAAGDTNAWENRDDGGARRPAVPLLHLVLSSCALAASLFYFNESSATGLDGLFETVLSTLDGFIETALSMIHGSF